MEDTDLKWRKSSYSGNGGGNCVEIAADTRGLVVRDTQDRTGSVLSLSADAWQAFTGSLKAS
jgi:Domain of unknown function (DUF397)